ncbi:MAG TPA: hypothetical protein VFC76_08060 [Oscillospiraceae bacterium]|nr:hypothetical protein [Oscillospiraceae bacterium]
MAKKSITKDIGDKLISVFIPKQNRNDTQRFVSVNGERILVRTGVEIKIPQRFAEVLYNSEAMQSEAENFIEANCSI